MKNKIIKKIAFTIIPLLLLVGCSANINEKNNENKNEQPASMLNNKVLPLANSNKVRFINYNGETLKETEDLTKDVRFNEEEPTRESTSKYDFKFKNWSYSYNKETNETIAKANFTPIIKSYKVEFYLEDGTLVNSQLVEYGKLPSLDFATSIDNIEDLNNVISPVTKDIKYKIKRRNNTPTYFSYGLVFQHFYNEETSQDEFAVTEYRGEDLNVIIPDSFQGVPVTLVKEGAFAGNNLITSITFGKNINEIERGAIYGCSNIERFNIAEGNENLFIKNDALFAKSPYLTLVAYPAKLDGSYELEARTNEFDYVIEMGAFNSSNLEILKYNQIGDNNVTYSLNYLFSTEFEDYSQFPTKLRTVFFNGGNIGENFFKNMTTLESVILENNLENPIETIGEYAFTGCSNLESIVIPSTVTDIENYAFNDCISLENVKLGFKELNINKIGKNIFQNCISLEGNPVDGICYIGNDTYPYQIAYKIDKFFKGDEITFKDGTIIIYDEILRNNIRIKKVNFEGNTLKTIGFRAFSYCKVTHFALPKSLTDIDPLAFIADNEEYDNTVVDDIRYISSTDDGNGVINEFYAFRSSKTATSTNILKDTRFIDIMFFRYTLEAYHSFSLDSENENFVVQNNALYGIDNHVLYKVLNGTNEYKINNLSYDNPVEYIGGKAFYCTNYTYVDMPYNITYIGSCGFGKMQNLKNKYFTSGSYIPMPGNLEFIGSYAFFKSGTTNLTFSFYCNNLYNIGTSAFKLGYGANTYAILNFHMWKDKEEAPASLFNYEWQSSYVEVNYGA